MSRPEFITHAEIARWDADINQDPLLLSLPKDLMESPVLREVCYAGCWLGEQLDQLQCPAEFIIRIQWHAGKLSFGRDAWDVHQKMLLDYQDNKLVFESEPNESVN
jgi:hypothetical protein